MLDAIARLLSLLGHPLLSLPAAVWLGSKADSSGPSRLLAPGLAAGASLVCLYLLWQVRRGHWRHVDASRPGERRQLNRLLLVSLALAAVLAWARGLTLAALGLAASASIIACALLGARRWTLSLHVAFAAFAASLLAALHPIAFAPAVLLVLALAWSRLRLCRHTRADIRVGALSGAGAGLLFLHASRLLAGR